MDSSTQEQPVNIKRPCGVLSGKQIENEMENGNIIIHPFDRSRLQSSSYDISIGEWYYTETNFNFERKGWLVYVNTNIFNLFFLKKKVYFFWFFFVSIHLI